jgi:hypothetical protein
MEMMTTKKKWGHIWRLSAHHSQMQMAQPSLSIRVKRMLDVIHSDSFCTYYFPIARQYRLTKRTGSDFKAGQNPRRWM